MGGRTFVIGDIHGEIDHLRRLVARMPDVGASDTVVFLGDYIDRGPDSKACVDAVLEFIATVPAAVVCLRGNHEDWMLRAMADYTHHSWLLGMDGLTTIRSYSAAAAVAIHAAAKEARGGAYEPGCRLPYELFFDTLPAAHRRFFESLRLVHETPECICAHGGVDPAVEGLSGQDRAFVWGVSRFPEAYAGSRPVVYGHHNNADIDDDDWPHPRVEGATYGLDTIAHGVLTAIRLPGPHVLQSARYQRRRG